MNIILEYVLVACAPHFITSSKVSLPLVKAFMDDVNLMSSSVSGAQTLLARCATALQWAGMEFRANKSRSFIIKKGKSLNSSPFCVSEPSNPTDFSLFIPSIHSMPVRFLGRIIDGSITDRKSVDELAAEKLSDGLKIIDKSPFKGTQKLWILQHLLIPRIQWPLLIYEVPMSVAMRLEQKVSTYIRKWLHLHQSTTNLCFYSSTSPCPLPINSLTSILKSCKISGHLLLRDSKDPLGAASNPVLKSGSWKVKDAVRSAESELAFQTIKGPPQFGRAGLGTTKSEGMPAKRTHKYRKLVSVTSKEIDEGSNTRKALQLQLQGQWTRWENYVKNDLSWKSLLAMPANLLSFCLASTYDVLPSPSNLKRWRICTESSCFLCSKEICTTAHVLGACKVSLTQGRFTFRHDSVLSELASILSSFIKALPTTPPKRLVKLAFVKAGKSVSKSKVKPTGILHLASDWVIVSDLQNSYIFPGHIALTSLRPDIVVFSNSLKRVILIELTCPCEENMESWHSIKLTKYSALVESILLNGWCVDLFAIEVGTRGYCSRSATTCLKRLGFGNKLAFSTAKTLGHKSMESSFYIWLARNSRSWSQNATDLIDSSNQPQPSHSAKSKPLPSKATIPVKPPCAGLINKGVLPCVVLCKFYLASFESHSNHVVSMGIRVFFSVPTCQIHCP